MYIAIDSILVDELLYPRNELSWRDVQRYIGALSTGSEFPPIVVGKREGRYVVIDGRHRYEAFRRSKKEKIPAMITKLPPEQWFSEAVRLNVVHGHPLSYQEKIKAAMILQKQKLSLEEISKVVAIQSEQLERVILQKGTWVRPEDVKPVVLKASIAAVAQSRGRQWLEKEAARIETAQEELSGRTVKDLVRELVTLLERDFVSDEEISILLNLQNVIGTWLSVREKK